MMTSSGLMCLVLLCLTSMAWASKSRCRYYTSRNQVTCSYERRSQTCNTVSPHGSSDTAPAGFYLIGERYTHQRHNLDWYNLYPQSSSDARTYYDYYRVNPDTGRRYIALHPGSLSLGCVTVRDSNCWENLKDIVDSGSPSQQTVSRSWFRTATINYVGSMTVI